MSLPRYTRWFIDLSKEDINIAGGKGAKLGELTQAKIPVPPGFVVLSSAYFAFWISMVCVPKFMQFYRAVTFLTKAIAYCLAKVQKLILGRNATRHEYGNNENYAKLGHDVYVAVRFSATLKIYLGHLLVNKNLT